jgi:hypothetical protein
MALPAYGLLAAQLEDLIEALNLAFGLFGMVGEGLLQILGGGLLGHFRERFENFVLGEVNVF